MSLLDALAKAEENEIDQEAWTRLVEMWTKPIIGYCKRRGLSREDTDDVTQIVMTRILIGICNFQRDGKEKKFRYWVSAILRNAVKDLCKRNAGQPAAAGGSDYRTILNNVQFDVSPNQSSVQAIVHDNDSTIKIVGNCNNNTEETVDCFSDVEIVQQALSLLKKQWKDSDNWKAFELVEFYGYSSKEAGAKIGKTDGSVRIAAKRIRDRLKQELDGMLSFHLKDEFQQNQTRRLNDYYPVIYFDEAAVTICQDDKKWESSICMACGTAEDGENELLGLWSLSEANVDSLSTIVSELKSRGMLRFGMACVDQNSVLTDALSEEWPDLQCNQLVHGLKGKSELGDKLASILKVDSGNAAKDRFGNLLSEWNEKNSGNLVETPFLCREFEKVLDSSSDVKTAFVGTLQIESLDSLVHRSKGKRIAFSSDKSALSILFLAIKFGDNFSSHVHEVIH